MRIIFRALSRPIGVSMLCLLAFFVALAGMDHPALAGTLSTLPGAEPQHTIQGHAWTDESPPRPVQQAVIVARRVGSDQVISTTTDADGAYSLAVPAAAASWVVRAQRGDNTVPAEALAPGDSRAVIFTGSRPPQVRTVDFTFPVASAHIRGRVLVTGTAQPPDIPVTVTAIQLLAGPADANVDQSAQLVKVSRTVDPATGAFDLPIPPGVYQVTVVPDDLARYLPPILSPVSVDKDQDLDLGDLYLIPLQLGDMGWITGRVQEPDGTPASGVQVMGLNLETRQVAMPNTTDDEGAFRLVVSPGTWWVATALGEDDPYMPYKLAWQTTVSVEAGQTVTDVVLIVSRADAVIHGELTAGEGGPPATDACGAVVAYKAGQPGIYNFRTFTGGTFDLPVITGTYRLVVTPDPGLEWLAPFLPEGCAAGKYLATVQKEVAVATAGVHTVTIPVSPNTATVHGRLWDRTLEQPVTGVSGWLVGWNPALHAFAGAQIQAETGQADLRAAPGDWLLAFRVDPNSGYRERPPVARTQVPADVADVDVHLNVVQAAATVTGTVLDPEGNPVPRAVVTALGLPGGDTVRTDEQGRFHLSLDYGAYVVEVLGPLQGQAGTPWITPEPVSLVLREGETQPTLTLRYRSGDATLHGRIVLSGTTAAANSPAPNRAMVWAFTRGGRTWTQVTLPMGAEEEYRLPAIQGQEWILAAAYWDGVQVWYATQRLTVEAADHRVDLTLIPLTSSPAVQRVQHAVETARAFYAELEDGVTLHVPAGALKSDAQVRSREQAAVRSLRKTLQLYRNDAAGLDGPLPAGLPALQDLPLDGGLHLISPAYTLGMVDRAANPLTDDIIQAPLILRIPYRYQGPGRIVALKQMTGSGVVAAGTQTASAPSNGWEVVDRYLVDEANQEVIVLVEEWGTYAVGVEDAGMEQVFLPLMTKP